MKIIDIIDLLTDAFGDDFNARIYNSQSEVKQLLTDSRNHFTSESTLFFAINTPGGNDGHNYIKSLYNKGIKNFVVEYIPGELEQIADINWLIVKDSINALTVIGKQHRERARELVAITGSRGKTTLKEMIFQLMEPYATISRSPRSYNSKIGVPLSLWQIPEETDLAIIEAGISKSGEMGRLTDAIQPDTVIFTNIGDAHSGGFSSIEEKTNEKTKLAETNRVETIIYPMDSNLLKESVKRKFQSKRLIGWSTKKTEADLFIEVSGNHDKEGRTILNYQFGNRKGTIEVILHKDYDLENIASALAFMLKEGLSTEQTKERFSNFHHIQTRLNVSEGINGCTVILDSYTSDLSSLVPAIDIMERRKMPGQKSTLILSDLHHEGKNVSETYKEMSDIIKETGISRFIGVGKTLKGFSSLFPNSEFFEDTDSLLQHLNASDFNDEIILLKGSPEFDFKKIYQQLEAKKHETVLEVNLDGLLRNYNYFRSFVPSTTGIIAMVKAFGYGAGSYEIAKTLQDAGASYLAVAALDEGISLREKGITMPIMVMNPRSANYKALFKNRLEPVVYSFEMLESLLHQAYKYGEEAYPVHIKLDTGMHRMGFEEKDLDELIEILEKSDNIKVESIFSHLATADCLDMDDYTHRQLKLFRLMSNRIMSVVGYNVKRHILNSAGIIRFPENHYELVRLGIGLYGANTLPFDIEKPLWPVSTLRTVIIAIREVEGDEAIGYGRRGKIEGKKKIATIPIGYADGFNRKYGNGAVTLLVNGHEAPTIGNICMDATMIDVTGIECNEGDPVEIFGEKMSIQRLADTLDTIPYEILTSVSPRVKRVYYRE